MWVGDGLQHEAAVHDVEAVGVAVVLLSKRAVRGRRQRAHVDDVAHIHVVRAREHVPIVRDAAGEELAQAGLRERVTRTEISECLLVCLQDARGSTARWLG